jgi:hypothetical protein
VKCRDGAILVATCLVILCWASLFATGRIRRIGCSFHLCEPCRLLLQTRIARACARQYWLSCCIGVCTCTRQGEAAPVYHTSQIARDVKCEIHQNSANTSKFAFPANPEARSTASIIPASDSPNIRVFSSCLCGYSDSFPLRSNLLSMAACTY